MEATTYDCFYSNMEKFHMEHLRTRDANHGIGSFISRLPLAASRSNATSCQEVAVVWQQHIRHSLPVSLDQSTRFTSHPAARLLAREPLRLACRIFPAPSRVVSAAWTPSSAIAWRQCPS
jgi:hypothetical protein